jgi:hypothetical protein
VGQREEQREEPPVAPHHLSGVPAAGARVRCWVFGCRWGGRTKCTDDPS